MDWKPDKACIIPLYQQIIDYIKKNIALGKWGLGTVLPNQRQLAERFGVNRSTVVEALAELKAEGLIEGRRKGGTIVVNNTWSLLAATALPRWEEYIEKGIHRPNLKTIQVINQLEFKKGIIRLGTGELSPELYPKEKMKKILCSISDKVDALGYEEPKGASILRNIISKYLKKYGIEAEPSSILIVSGSLQALQLIALGILHPGASVLAESPSYLKSLHVFESSGMKLKGVEMDNSGAMPSSIIKNIAKRGASLFYTIPTYHNPTGILMPKHRREEVLKTCNQERLPIIEDDVYRELWLDEKPPLPLKAHDKSNSVLYLGSISKTLVPGLRIGWLVGPEAVVRRLGDIKMQTDYGASSLSQWATAEWISSGLYEEYLSELKEQLRLRRNMALESLDKYFSELASWREPSGGFYIWVTLKKAISMNKLFETCCKEGILINPGYVYDFRNNLSLRISYAYASLEELDKGLKRLSELIGGGSK